jgi:hypothetical protein
MSKNAERNSEARKQVCRFAGLQLCSFALLAGPLVR